MTTLDILLGVLPDPGTMFFPQTIAEYLAIFLLDLPDPREALFPQTIPKVLAIFEQLLPDPNQNLFTQDAQFTLFSELPPELRIEIWKMAFPAPRTYKLWNMMTLTRRPIIYHTPLPVTALVCQESRY
jgi:2EXR family